MILDMNKNKEPPCCQDGILEDGSELGMQGKKQRNQRRNGNLEPVDTQFTALISHDSKPNKAYHIPEA